MIVSRGNFEEVVARLSAPGQYGLDTETTGLTRKDRLFSVILSDAEGAYYFNFNQRADHLGNYAPEENRLPREWIVRLTPILANESSTFFIHNAKFDLSMLARDGVAVLGSVHCTEALARVLRNDHLGSKPYSLASCAKRIGLTKDTAVDEYIKKHKLSRKVQIPGKDKAHELKFFDQVPFPIMAQYGQTDAVIHRELGLSQLRELALVDATAPSHAPKVMLLVANEYPLTKVCHWIEETGVRINRQYTHEALAYTQQAAASASQRFAGMTGLPFEDSATTLKAAFEKVGIALPKTATGKPCTKKEVLDDLENPLAELIREIRGYNKLCSTYFSSFLHFADSNDLIHANMRQGGTETLRFSYSDPNLQNLPKEDEPEDQAKPYLVRRCFMPRSPDYCFVPIDYKQQEFRMMLDYAGERELIAAIMGGMDVHDATAQLLGITRKQAKTINFGLLYGMGAAKLARQLGVSLEEAYRLKNLYFAKLPRVKTFIRTVMKTSEGRGYIWNWNGFRSHCANPQFAYKLPNHLIQGGCAQVVRIAMVRVHEYMRKNCPRSYLVGQVHDELWFEMHRSELHHVPALQKIMEGVYVPKNGLYLDCSVEHSWKSLAKWDQVKGYPNAA